MFVVEEYRVEEMTRRSLKSRYAACQILVSPTLEVADGRRFPNGQADERMRNGNCEIPGAGFDKCKE